MRAARVAMAAASVAIAMLVAGCASPPSGTQHSQMDRARQERAQTHFALAAGYFENGQYDIALNEQRETLEADPGFSDAYNLGGMIHMARGDRTAARTDFQRAIQLNPRDGNAMHNLGWLMCEEGDYASAEEQFDRALALPTYRDAARTLMTKGICQARGGHRAEARATLMRAYELDAGNPVTGFSLASLMLEQGDPERARFYIRRINNSELANAESLWLGIRIERQLGNHDAMQQLAAQLRRHFPDSHELHAYDHGEFDD